MRTLKALLLATSVLATGCATKFEPPRSPNEARLTTAVDYGGRTIGIVRVQAFADEKCQRHPFGVRVATFANHGERAEPKSVSLPADVPLVLTFSVDINAVVTYVSCRATQAFTPRAN